jgi:hypothetical protein
MKERLYDYVEWLFGTGRLTLEEYDKLTDLIVRCLDED